MHHNLAIFSLDNILNKMSEINAQIALANNTPFPKKDLLSNYQYEKRPLHFNSNGGIQGGYPRLITSVIDFSFIRSIVAHTYSDRGPACYDPPTLFLLDLFHYIDEAPDLKDFLENTLHDEDKGRGYRTYAGILHRIPCQGTFSHFRKRLGHVLYNEIFHTLVEIFRMLKIVSGNILGTDGTLYPTRARYRGCKHFDSSCVACTCDNVIPQVRDRIIRRLNDLSHYNLNKEIRIHTECPHTFPEEVKEKPKIQLLAFRLAFTDHDPTANQTNTAKLFQVEEELKKQGLVINTTRSNVTNIDYHSSTFTVNCPKLPKDPDAKIGVRRDPKNPDKKEYIFGFNAIVTTSIEPHLALELPMAGSNIAGNAEEGKYLRLNRDQIAIYHPKVKVKLDLADAKYDELDNFSYSRASGAIPIIDMNPRSEDLSKKALKARGFDENGTPFAPCGILTRANGFDKKTNSIIYCCFKQCLTLRAKGIKTLQETFDIASCTHVKQACGFSPHMAINDHPRHSIEIPRGTERYKKIRALRSASERTNSSIKQDLTILNHPKVMGSLRSAILTQMACIVLLLKRSFDFIIRITRLTMNPNSDNHEKLAFKKIPLFLKNMVFLE
jgi:hypothetical protein